MIRIIPTRMGTSTEQSLRCFHSRDHPHAYGDKARKAKGLTLDVGSSPRVWGQETLKQSFYVATGIIPTRMGTSKIKRRDTAV